MSTRTTNRIQRSAGLNNTRRSVTFIDRDPGSGGVLRGTGLAFVSPNQITDSGNNLARFGVGSLIGTRGSPTNSRSYEVTVSAAGTLTLIPAAGITSEIAGPTIIIERQDHV
jgi:hypothetical protein